MLKNNIYTNLIFNVSNILIYVQCKICIRRVLFVCACMSNMTIRQNKREDPNEVIHGKNQELECRRFSQLLCCSQKPYINIL